MPVFNFLFWNTPQSSAKPITPMIPTRKAAPSDSELPKLQRHFCFRFCFDGQLQRASLWEGVNPVMQACRIHTMMHTCSGKASMENASSSRCFRTMKRRPKSQPFLNLIMDFDLKNSQQIPLLSGKNFSHLLPTSFQKRKHFSHRPMITAGLELQ